MESYFQMMTKIFKTLDYDAEIPTSEKELEEHPRNYLLFAVIYRTLEPYDLGFDELTGKVSLLCDYFEDMAARLFVTVLDTFNPALVPGLSLPDNPKSFRAGTQIKEV